MFAKWLEEYRKISEQSRILSKLSAFLISIFSILSLYDLTVFFDKHPEYLNILIEESGLLSSIFFQASVGLIFASRFIVLFSKSKKAFWINQVLWASGLIVLASYWFMSRPPENLFKIYSMDRIIFKHASRGFDSLGILYLWLSPFLRLLTFYISLIRYK